MTDTLNRDKTSSILFDFYIESAAETHDVPVSESSRIAMHGQDWEISCADINSNNRYPQVVFTAKRGKLFKKVES